MEFTERCHAFISASFYKKLRDGHGDRGLAIFAHATRCYGGQRGSRMAQKAIALGLPLTFETYCALGEWNYSDSYLKAAPENRESIISIAPDYCSHVFDCPWSAQYKDMGLSDGAILYCRFLDTSIAHAFNPELDFRVLQTINEADRCVFVSKNANLAGKVEKRQEYVLPFEYHCAHIYHTFSGIAKSVLKTAGAEIAASVLSEFGTAYEREMAEKLTEYANTDFNLIYLGVE